MNAAADEADDGADSERGAQRLDKWLWFARVVKSRTMAAGLVAAGKVRVNRQRTDKASHALKPGDVVTVNVGRKVRVLRVKAAGQRRGPAAEAQGLFEDLTPPETRSGLKEPGSGETCSASAVRAQGDGRPTKRQRREIDKLRGRR